MSRKPNDAGASIRKAATLAIFGAAAILAGCSGSGGDTGRAAPPDSTAEVSIETDPCRDAICLAEQATAVWRSEGIEASVRYVEARSAELERGAAVCHDGLHRVGSAVAELGGEADLDSSVLAACSGGFFHGLFAAYGTTAGWADRMVEACRPFTEVDALLCKHGYGHGAAAGGEDVESGLRRCEVLVEADGSGAVEGVSLYELCGDGFFMEVVHFVESGKWGNLDPVGTCSALDGWQAWGCWRQMGRLTGAEGLAEYAAACNSLDEYLAEGCAVGVAEAAAAVGGEADACGLLLVGRELCASRVSGLR